MEGADPVGRGGVAVEALTGFSNTFEQDTSGTHDLFMDLERLTTDVGVRWGPVERLELGGRLSLETTGGGFLDSFISAWHEMLHLPDADRSHYPFGRYMQRLRDKAKTRIDVPSRTMAPSDVSLSAKWSAWRSADGRRVLSLAGVARRPLQDDGIGPRRTDVSLAALTRVSWTRWHLHASAGGGTQRIARDYPDLMRDGSFFADVALERAATLDPHLNALVQFTLESPRLKGFHDGELDAWPGNLIFGMTGKFGDDWRVEASFQEDIPAASPAADFTLLLGVRRSW